MVEETDNELNDRKALELVFSYRWGDFEEAALPNIRTFIRAYLAGDPYAKEYADLVHSMNGPVDKERFGTEEYEEELLIRSDRITYLEIRFNEYR